MNIRDEIARTAHELYLKSGCVSGRDLENWVEAERIVKARHEAAQSHKKNPEASVEEPAKKTAPASVFKKAAEPKKAPETKKAPAKKTGRTKKSE